MPLRHSNALCSADAVARVETIIRTAIAKDKFLVDMPKKPLGHLQLYTRDKVKELKKAEHSVSILWSWPCCMKLLAHRFAFRESVVDGGQRRHVALGSLSERIA